MNQSSMSASTLVSGRLQALRRDPMLVNSALLFATTMLMAGGGAVFWVIAARLQPPSVVGLAGSLVATAEALALFAQLGLNIALVRTLPESERQASDVLTAGCVVSTAGAALGLGYCLLLPLTSPRLGEVLGSPWVVAVFCLLVAGTALNVLTDSVFLSLNRVWAHLRLNGGLLVGAKLTLPFLLAGAGAFGLYGSVGGATLICALASLLVAFRYASGGLSLSPSPQLRRARGFAGAGYASYVLHVVPQMVLPLLVINALGAAHAGVFFVSFQIVTLQNAVVLAVANATYSEAEKARTGRHAVVRRGALTMVLLAALGVLVMVVLAPLLLRMFGAEYAGGGTTTLRLLSLSTLATAFDYWAVIRLRLSRRHGAMIGVQAVSTVVMLGLAAVVAPYGTEWVAAAWGVGHLVGGALGYLVTLTVARFPDAAAEVPAAAPRETV